MFNKFKHFKILKFFVKIVFVENMWGLLFGFLKILNWQLCVTLNYSQMLFFDSCSTSVGPFPMFKWSRCFETGGPFKQM